jgi:hypothetical protein
MTDLARSKQKTVRLACPCGRNLADVRLLVGEPRGVIEDPPLSYPEHVWPFPRPGVRQREHQHSEVIPFAWDVGRPHPPQRGRRRSVFTFAWDCRCGRSHEARRDRIDAVWREHARIGRTVRLTLGTDV